MPIIFKPGSAMKGYSIFVLAIAMALLTLPSSSAFILCTAPGGHMAIEDIDAGCCGHGSILHSASESQPAAFNSGEDCENCVDLLLCPNEQVAFSKAGSTLSNLARAFTASPIPEDNSASVPHGTYPAMLPSGITQSPSPLRC